MTSLAVHGVRRTWPLSTTNTTYVVRWTADNRLVQQYWGPRLSPAETETISEDTYLTRPHEVPLEIEEQLPVDGGLRWGIPALQITFPGGIRSLELDLVSDLIEQEDGGQRLDLVLADRFFPLQVVLHYRTRENSDVIERWTTLRHTGTEGEPFTITRADSGNWLIPERADYRYSAVSGAWMAENHLRREPLPIGELTLTNRTGNPSHHANPWLMIDDGTATEGHGDVWGVALAWSGTWRLTAQRRFEGRAAMTAGFGHDGTVWRLQAGEELTTPALLGLYSADGFGGASRSWHQHAHTHILPRSEHLPPILYNSWEAVGFDIDEQSQLHAARQAADLGVELFVVDDGWFGKRIDDTAGLGDWWPNPDRFPHGLRPLADQVRALGMDFGLWVEPEMVNPDSDLYHRHPDWVVHYPHRRRDELRTQLVLNFARQDVREWAHGRLDELVAELDIRFLKWDMNRAFSQGGWPEREGDQDRLWIDHTRGVYAIMDRLRADHPRLRIEACSGGGGRLDFGILARTDQVWTSDNTDAYHRQTIQHGFSQVYPAQTMAAWVTDEPHIPLEYRFHVAMTGNLGIGGNLTTWSEADRAIARQHITLYKDIRTTVQRGRQHRLGATPGQGLSALQYTHDDDVVIFVLHPHPGAQPGPATVRLADLDPDALYRTLDDGHQATGRLLMTNGLPLLDRMRGGHWASAVVRLRRHTS
ncbi:alpha-galactosidase [Streptomyces coerulescens]|uniref:Alpha-galactosidase n=1 Tax=Streptomyces coerulescens TaxID=29304 RepID=A0ABW0D1M3_STRCD